MSSYLSPQIVCFFVLCCIVTILNLRIYFTAIPVDHRSGKPLLNPRRSDISKFRRPNQWPGLELQAPILSAAAGSQQNSSVPHPHGRARAGHNTENHVIDPNHIKPHSETQPILLYPSLLSQIDARRPDWVHINNATQWAEKLRFVPPTGRQVRIGDGVRIELIAGSIHANHSLTVLDNRGVSSD